MRKSGHRLKLKPFTQNNDHLKEMLLKLGNIQAKDRKPISTSNRAFDQSFEYCHVCGSLKRDFL